MADEKTHAQVVADELAKQMRSGKVAGGEYAARLEVKKRTPCTACGEGIVGDFIKGGATEANMMEYHRKCFNCAECGTSLDEGYLVKQGKCVCGACGEKAKASGVKVQKGLTTVEGVYERHEGECGHCLKPLGRALTVKCGKTKYHRECFKCKKCDVKLGGEFVNINDTAYCKGCGTSAVSDQIQKKTADELRAAKAKYEAERKKREAQRAKQRAEREAAFKASMANESDDDDDDTDDDSGEDSDEDTTPCGICGKKIGYSAVVEYAGKKHHRRCWVCYTCFEPLKTSSMQNKGGKYYCGGCAGKAPATAAVAAPAPRRAAAVEEVAAPAANKQRFCGECGTPAGASAFCGECGSKI